MSDSNGRNLRRGAGSGAAGLSGGSIGVPAARAASRSMTFISPGLYHFGRNRTKAARHCPAGPQVAIGCRANLHSSATPCRRRFSARMRGDNRRPVPPGEDRAAGSDVTTCPPFAASHIGMRCGAQQSGPNRFCGHRMTQHGQVTVPAERGRLPVPSGRATWARARRAYALFRRAARVIEPRLLIDLEHARRDAQDERHET
jgi:hypothetical protein